jgi:hypothetical protein
VPRRLIFTLRDFPTTEDFVYLRRFKRWPADCNPYALEVVQFADIDQANYYTMSVRGITHYIDGVNAEFASRSRACHAGLCLWLTAQWMGHSKADHAVHVDAAYACLITGHTVLAIAEVLLLLLQAFSSGSRR